MKSLNRGRAIDVLEGISMVKDGMAHIPLKNFGEEEEELAEGEGVAKVVILKEARDGEKGLLMYKDVEWPSKDPIREAKERDQGLERERG